MNYPRLKKEATDSLDDNVDIVEFDVNGYKKTLEMTKVTITDVFKKPIGKMRFFKDITQERLLEIQVLHNSNTDFLTGLYNRRYFYNYISDNCIGKPLGVLFIDLDNFKSINDTYGHQAGDDALVLTADVLHRNCHDGLIVRNGGDEFIVVTVNDLSLDDVKKRAATLLFDLVSSFKEDSRFKGLSASIGLSFVEKLNEDIDEVLKRCDAAMYSAKKSSKGSYCIARN
jgi:diguanylate cyclase (GGDEF)-like protein